ncbi:MAG: signal peptidase I [Acidobacteria bacterium]|nr:MAG: signal peptidase I [Acidobacteriota bacterium]
MGNRELGQPSFRESGCRESVLLELDANSGSNEADPPSHHEAPRVPPSRKRAVSNMLSHVQFAMLALTIAMFIITFVAQAFRIPSGSMEDTLLVGDYLLVDKTRFGPGGLWQSFLPYRNIHRGDVVIFRYPVDPAEHFIKRVIGLPGDRIYLSQRRVYVNGRALQEPYAVFKERYSDKFRDNFPRCNRFNENVEADWASRLRNVVKDGELIVPRGQYFVLGDNRDQSLDSRYWGFVPRDNIIGRPFLIYFSLVEADDEEDQVESNAVEDGKLFTLRARISHVIDRLRWPRILRLVP